MPTRHTLPSGRLTPLVLGGGALAAALLAWRLETANRADDRKHFASLGTRLEQVAAGHYEKLESALGALNVLWTGKTERVSRAEFRTFIQTNIRLDELPSVTGIGFVRRVPQASLGAFLQATRADESPDFKVSTLGTTRDLQILELIEPAEPNRAVLGLDLGQNPALDEATQEAASSGKSISSQPLPSTQTPNAGPGFLLLQPVYTPGPLPASLTERRKHLAGWTCLSVAAPRLLAELERELGGELVLELAHGNPSTAPASPPRAPLTISQHPWLAPEHRKTLPFAGNTWQLIAKPAPNFAAASRLSFRTALICGIGLGLALISHLLLLRRRARQALTGASPAPGAPAENERLLARVATHTKIAVVLTDARRRITWVNASFTRLSGYPFAEALGRNPGQLLQCEHSNPEVIKAMREALDLGCSFQHEILNRRKNGSEYWTDLEIVPLHDTAGSLTGFMAVSTDVTASKEAAVKLRENNERQTQALTASGLALWEWHVPSGETFFDARWAAQIGEEVTQLAPRIEEWSSRCHPEDLPLARAAQQRYFSGETPVFRYLHRLRHREGSWRWILACGHLVSRTPEGNPLQLVGTHQDVTHSHLQQLHLERESQSLNLVGRLAHIGCWELDLATDTLHWNDTTRAIHEVPAGYVPNPATARAFYPGTAEGKISRLIQSAIDRGESFDIELPFTTARGNPRWVRTLGEAVRVGGVTVAVRGAIQDVSDFHQQKDNLAAARDEAESATKAKAEFLASMSHEIRTPINAVVGMTELLKNTRLSPEQTEFTDTIRTSSENLLALITDILDFSKIEAGALELKDSALSLRDCAEQALEIVAGPAAAKNVELFLTMDPALPPGVLGDAARLRQILINLLVNAVQFTPAGEVELSLTAPPVENDRAATLRFTVRDTGVGIAPRDLARLTRTFTQTTSFLPRGSSKSGLGLAITARLVQLMRGRIWAESILSLGSSFHIELPFRPATPPVAPPTLPVCLRGYSVLVVVAHPGLRRQLVAQLDAWGFHVLAADDTASARSQMESGRPLAVAVVDSRMPDLAGASLSPTLLPPPHPQPLPLVLLAQAGDTLPAFAASPLFRIIAKPVKSVELLDAVVQLLLPIEPTPPARPRSQVPARLNIVLAEDLPVNQRVALLILEKLGHSASVANHGFEALALISRQPVDILFLDIQMPEMDGFTCAKRLCEQYSPSSRPWIIAMTANALDGDRERCLAAGMDDYISKPISGPALAAAIERAVEGLAPRRSV